MPPRNAIPLTIRSIILEQPPVKESAMSTAHKFTQPPCSTWGGLGNMSDSVETSGIEVHPEREASVIRDTTAFQNAIVGGGSLFKRFLSELVIAVA
jgi:hypothetical protein